MESNQYDEKKKKKGNFMKNVFCFKYYMLIQTVL